MTILDPEALNAAVRDLNKQIGDAQQKLAAYESRKVPLSEADAARIFHAHPVESDGPSALAVARAALVASESPVAVEAALAVWNDAPWGNRQGGMLAAIRAAHDAAIDGGCGAAREADEVVKLRERVATLETEKANLAHNYASSEEARKSACEEREAAERLWGEAQDRCDDLREHVATLEWDRDAFVGRLAGLEKENADLRRQIDAMSHRLVETITDLSSQLDDALGTVNMQRVELVSVRDSLDALTKPIDGVEELGRIGWEAWHRVHWPQSDPKHKRSEDSANADNASAQAVASRVIGALRSEIARSVGSPLGAFDAAVASLKIEPAKVEPKREADDAEQFDTRPIVKVGQVWRHRHDGEDCVAYVGGGEARFKHNLVSMTLSNGRCRYGDEWTLISDTPTPKREPFELPSMDNPSMGPGCFNASPNEIALRDRIREIERRLEAGGL